MLERLQSVFRKVFEDENLNINLKTNESEIKMWDSLTHLQLIAAIEDEFKIKFTFQEVMKMYTVTDIINILERK
jgi:acyl carrier protein